MGDWQFVTIIFSMGIVYAQVYFQCQRLKRVERILDRLIDHYLEIDRKEEQ